MNRLGHNKMKILRIACFTFLILCLGGWGPFDFINRTIEAPKNKENWLNHEILLINSQANNLDPLVLKRSLIAYLHAEERGISNKNLLMIIDYSKPSSERRLWVVDLKRAKVLFNTWVVHGKNSGKINATSFSNQPGSLKSSLGVFITTSHPYFGSNGYSLRLLGLENGFNDKAFERDIVIHGAWYAHPNVIKKYGLLGRSWGCPAVSENTVRPLINTIKDKTLVVMYYPDRKWLNHSTFLADEGRA